MKNFLLLTIGLILFTNSLSAQDESWFTDITVEAGLEGFAGPKIQCVDVNGDDYPDLLIGTGGLTKGNSNTFTLLLNVPNDNPQSAAKRKFIDYTEESGINVNRNPDKDYREYDVAVFADVDNDGDPDLVSSFYYHRLEWFENGHNDRSEVYLNDGNGHFTLKEDAGLHDFSFSTMLEPGMVDAVGISFLDYDYDGNIDLYLATKFLDYARGFTFPDFIFKGDGTGRFIHDPQTGVGTKLEPLYGINVTDWNNDGWQDVITSPYCRPAGRILKNMKNGTFKDVADEANYSIHHYGGVWTQDDNGNIIQATMCQWEAPTADFDNDGDMDLIHTMVHGGNNSYNGVPAGRSHIAVNQGPPDYEFVTDVLSLKKDVNVVTQYGDFGSLWSDFNNDGWMDACLFEGYYSPQTRKAYFFLQDPETNEFTDKTKALGLEYMVDAADGENCDFDLDGDDDIFVFHNDGEPRLRLLRNDVSDSSNWISVQLTTPENCNGSAMGARIRVFSGDLHQIREIQAGTGHFGGQKPLIRNFGLADHGGVDSIQIRWPRATNQVTTIYNPPINLVINVDDEDNVEVKEFWEGEVALGHYDASMARFDTVLVGESKEEQFEIINIGDADLLVSSLELFDPENAFSIEEAPELPFTVKPGQKEIVKMSFAPSDRKDYFAQVRMQTNAHNRNLQRQDIWGYGYSPRPFVVYSSNSIEFTDAYAGEKSEKLFTIENIGEETLEIESIEIIDENQVFAIENPALPDELLSGEKAELTISFLAPGKNSYSGTIEIQTNAFNEQKSIIDLEGTADGPISACFIEKPSIFFTSTEIGKVSVEENEIINEGDADLLIYSLEFIDHDDVFSTNIAEFPHKIESGATFDLEIKFKPLEDVIYTTDVILKTNAYQDSTKEFSVRGRGEITSVDFIGIVANSAKITPNPASSSSKLLIDLIQPENISLALYDESGKMIFNLAAKNYPAGFSSIDLPISNLSSGSYRLMLSSGKYRKSLQLIINK